MLAPAHGFPPAYVSAEFASTTKRLAIAFSRVDEYLIGMALAEFDKSELDFINSDHAIIRTMSSRLTPVAPSVRDMTKERKSTDLFSVSLGAKERLCTFVAKEEGGYHVRRVERAAGKYIQSDLFGLAERTIVVTDDGVVLLPTAVSGNPRVLYIQRFLLHSSLLKEWTQR